MSELSGSNQAGLTSGLRADPSNAPAGSEEAEFGKQWIDLLQQFIPLPRLNDGFDTLQDTFAKTFDNPFLSALIQSSQQRRLLEGLHRENANYQRALMKYQAFCSEVFRESMQRVSKRLEQYQEVEDGRKLFDTWIDIAEQTYAEKTQDENFDTLIGDLINAMSQVRHQYNLASEEVLAAFNLPVQGEVGEMHEKLNSMQGNVRQLEAHIESLNQRLEMVETGVVTKKSRARKIRKTRHTGTPGKKQRKVS